MSALLTLGEFHMKDSKLMRPCVYFPNHYSFVVCSEINIILHMGSFAK